MEEDDLIPAAGPGHWNDPDMVSERKREDDRI